MVKLLCLDADGTVFNTMPLLERLATRLMKVYGLSPVEAGQLYTETSGLPFCDQLELLFPKHTYNTRVAGIFEKRKNLLVLREKTVFDDTARLLERRRTVFGLPCALVSSTRRQLVNSLVSRNGLADQFEWTGGIEFGDKTRQLQRLTELFKLEPTELLFVGDSPVDSNFSSGADIPFVGLARDERHVSRFKHLVSSERLVFSLSQLEKFL